MANVDVGLPVPLGNYSYLPPVQTGVNDVVEEKAMNPLLGWLAGQGIDLAAEKTGVKDVLRERAAGLLDLIGLGEAQAAESPAVPPVQTGFQPATNVVAQDVVGTPIPETIPNPSYVPDSAIPMEGRRLPSGEQTLIRQDWRGSGRGVAPGSALPDGSTPVNMDGEMQSQVQARVMRDAQKLIGMGLDTPQKIAEAGAKEAFEADQRAAKTPPGSPPPPPPESGVLGTLGDYFKSEEAMSYLVMGLNSLRSRPDQGIAQTLGKRIETLRDKKNSGRTAQWLRSQGYNKYADLVEQYPEMAKDVVSAVVSASVKAPTAAESKIARIEELGFTRDQAIRISDLTDIILDPDTKTPILVDKATGRRVAPMTPRADMAPSAPAAAPQQPQMPPSGQQFRQRQLPPGVVIETPKQTLERADIGGALGVPGFISEAINLPFELIGADRPMDEQARARTFMQDLTGETMLAFASAFPGKPSNLTREAIENMTVKADDLAQGPQKALDKQGNLLRTMYNAMESAKYIAESGEGYSSTQRNEAREKYNELVPLFDKHVALHNKLKEAQEGRGSGAKGPRGPVISPEVGSLLQKPEYQ
jgi:hypothetical protein